MGFATFDSDKISAILENTEKLGRKKYFEDMGITLENVHDLSTVLRVTGLGFHVEKFPLQFMAEQEFELNGEKAKAMVPYAIPDQFATVRTDTMQSLGVVGKNYEILQNEEMFDFLDSLSGLNAQYVCGGTYGRNKAKNFITMSTEPIQILGDDYMPYINFLNSFDGSGSIRAYASPVRLFCSNCIVRSLKKAQQSAVIKHSRTMQSRLNAAKYVLLQNTKYLEALKEQAEKLAVTPFSAQAYEALLHELFPVKTEDTQRVQTNNMAQIEYMLNAYRQDDLQNFNNTAWKAVNAIADVESHPLTLRKTSTPGGFTNVIVNGMPLLNQVWNRMQELVVA